MQAFSSFSWVPEFMQTHDKMACSKPHPKPLVNIPLLNQLKRRRTDSDGSPTAPSAAQLKKAKLLAAAQTKNPAKEGTTRSNLTSSQDVSPSRAPVKVINTIPTPRNMEEDNTNNQTTGIDYDPQLRKHAIERIETHISLQILVKHNELRLIEQETAKCQIALEQLRRCHAIPFPGQVDVTAKPEQLVGAGPALLSQPGYSQPSDSPAWGVTDGPYTRHYAQWLIPDPRFDPFPIQQTRSAEVAPVLAGKRTNVAGKGSSRSTRGAVPAEGATGSRRRSTAAKLSSLPNYGVAKDKNSTLTIRRASDGLMVKIICKYCSKDNVSNLQGFLNHCRIQHKVEYASHNAALDDCGVPLDESELAALNLSAVEQQPGTPSMMIPANSSTLVHPLIKENRRESTAGTPSVPTSSPRASSIVKPDMPPPKLPARLTSGASSSAPDASFTPSSQTPALSKYLAKLGSTGNLSSLVDQAKDRSDINKVYEEYPSSEDEESAKPANTKAKGSAKPRGGRRSTGGVTKNQRPVPTPLKLQLPAQRLASIGSSATANVLSASTATPGAMTGTTLATATSSDPMTADTPNWPEASPYSAPGTDTHGPTSDIQAFTSTFGSTTASSSIPSGPTAASTPTPPKRTTKPRAHRRTKSQAVPQPPITPVETVAAARTAVEVSPTHTAENPGLMTDDDEAGVRSLDEEESEGGMEVNGQVDVDVKREAGVRIRGSVDETAGRDGAAAEEKK